MSQDWQDPYADDEEPQNAAAPDPVPVEPEVSPDVSLFEPEPAEKEEPFILESFTPPTQAESARRFGLGWAAGVAFSSAIAFMVFLGWLVDLLIGTSPWGIVAGVVIGAAIGFFELFRISSRIFPKSSAPRVNPLLAPHDHEDRP
ncbi:MAG: putative F0F1-ATPase subunit (ATPase gene1) [Acidobacteria bacterium OLB17]|nr:MAG: putative F0F1-ATPase subunit (ATPase gene1) [Acidobacteria bacterium OLB17]MCZ2390218.1 AtpZ/AtpI family protein [Acidobacteriota bacterium]